ncbi:MAG: hypothetical protein KME29_38650 [Calothrix sp. FI2-JRJ7]|jgi:hypothetical protein|nr:hypothetical protein [Calothrix sp. FI2-JRJ7]
MAETIKIYNSMAKFYVSMGGALNQEVDFTIHRLEEIHSEAPYKSPLFRANYYSIVMISSGQGRYIVNSHFYDMKPCTIYFSNPGHVKGFEVYKQANGFVITFAESFLKQYVHEEIFNEFPFLIAEIVPPQYPELSIFQNFHDLGTQLLQEYNSTSTYKFKIVLRNK